MIATPTALPALPTGGSAAGTEPLGPDCLPEAAAVLASIGAGVITTDLTGRVTFLNPAAARLTGWTAAEARGRLLGAVLPLVGESNRQPVVDPAMRCLAEDRPVDLEPGVVLIRRDGTEVPIGDSAAPIRDPRGQTVGVVLVVQDESEKRRVGRRLMYEASHDALTGLVNRREFDRRLARVVEKAGPGSADHALMILDLDGFKQVNDRGGHQAGDALLGGLGPVLGRHLRQRDTVGRLGGDEFGVLLEKCALPHAERVAEKLRAAIDAHRVAVEGAEYAVTASIGLVAIGPGAGVAAEVMRRADAACYEAKAGGGNRVHVVPLGAPVRTPSSAGRMARLVRAADDGEFRLFAQPILPLHPGLTAPPWTEVLLRLPDGRGGMLDAASFLPDGELDPMMSVIDHWVVRETLALMGRRRQLHPTFPQPRCSVNLGGSSLTGDSLLPMLERQLQRQGVPPGQLWFELDESVACRTLARTARLVAGLRAVGCGVVLDNYGGGAASLACLRSLPVSGIKVRAALLTGASGRSTDASIVASLRSITRSLGIVTVATHVEEQGTPERLRALGLEFAQGRALAPPAPLTDHEGWVQMQRLQLVR